MQAQLEHTCATVRQYLMDTQTSATALSFEATGRGGVVKKILSANYRRFDARTARKVLATIKLNPDGL